MAKKKTVSTTGLNTTLILVLVIGVIAGFAAGFYMARDRYTDKITEISKMNMDRAVEIDGLENELEVLGAKTKAEE